MIGGDVVCDAIDPGLEGTSTVKPGQTAPKLKVDILQQILPLGRVGLVAGDKAAQRGSEQTRGSLITFVSVFMGVQIYTRRRGVDGVHDSIVEGPRAFLRTRMAAESARDNAPLTAARHAAAAVINRFLIGPAFRTVSQLAPMAIRAPSNVKP